MTSKQQVQSLWACIHAQNWPALAVFFTPDAQIYWHNTNERFTPEEFVRANSEYPGDWAITLQRLEETETGVVSVVQVALTGEAVTFHATSFFTFAGGAIARLDEYWGDDGPPPAWRREKSIGRPIE